MKYLRAAPLAVQLGLVVLLGIPVIQLVIPVAWSGVPLVVVVEMAARDVGVTFTAAAITMAAVHYVDSARGGSTRRQLTTFRHRQYHGQRPHRDELRFPR